MSVSDPRQFIEASVTTSMDGRVELRPGDCREVLRLIPDASIDSVVTDPPYALVSVTKRFGKDGSAPAKSDGATGVYQRASSGFMGKTWDTGEAAFAVEFWGEVFRVLKPGGHVVAFSGTRTYHRLACAIEDAGFEIRDQIKFVHDDDVERDAFLASLNDEQRAQFAKLFAEDQSLGQLAWDYGTGFPKSHDVSKGIDKAAGAERETVRVDAADVRNPKATGGGRDGMAGATRPWIEKARELGYHEKQGDVPATEAARQWQGWGTALKPAWEPIVLARKPLIGTVAENVLQHGTGAINVDGCRVPGAKPATTRGASSRASSMVGTLGAQGRIEDDGLGRWPANVVHDGSDEVEAAFAAFGEAKGAAAPVHKRNGDKFRGTYGAFRGDVDEAGSTFHGDTGSASRFFYSAKASKADRAGSKHPTVKPVDLMRWLCRLVTPPGGVVLDPFAGSGTTGAAAHAEGFRCILIEREAEYQADIEWRLLSLGEAL